MAYCYECGEQVAENDIFCPYCGITLPASSAVDDAAKDAAGDAVAAAPLDSADNFSNDVTADDLDLESKSAETSTNEKQADEPAKDVLPAAENANMPPTGAPSVPEPPPMPQILERLTPPAVETSEKPAPVEMKTTESPFEANAVKPVEETNLDPIFVSSEGETVEDETAAQNESSLTDYAAAKIKEIPSPAEPETSIDDSENQPNEIKASDFDLKMNFTGAPLAADEKTETPVAEQPIENIPIPEQPITMPPMDLPALDDSAPSRFDSVSIMERAFGEDEKPPPTESRAPETEIPAAPETAAPQSDEPSATQQNIGVKDTDDKKKAKLKPLDEGTVLNGRYEIVRKIGGGGMGAVYLASDKNLGGVLRAVKEMVQSYIEDAQQEKAVNDFKRESLLLTSLDHQSIPTIYDYFFDDKEARFYLVMKYISGGDLSGRLRSAPEGRVDETNVTLWAIQIADVLDYLHNRQPPIIYRDLKPANVMVDGNSGRVMLIDFGIARWVNKEEKGVTAVGTMGYAPPELFSGNVEPRSDIYSLGSTMFHLLTGADPQSNPLLIFDFQKHPRPRQINPQLSDQMERILMRAVEYNADKRFASAAEMRQQLEDHLANFKAGRVTFGVAEAPASIALSDQPVFCGFCGQKIVATDMFCAFCGAKQPLAQQGVHAEGYAPAPLTAQLLIIGTNELEQPAFRLEKDENLVGRRDPQSNIFPEVDLSKYDPQTKISRRHARIWREGSDYMVEDLGSSNGTFILPVVKDAMRLAPRQPQVLTNGDKLKLGDTTLHFVLG